jgi:hypothetical protein
MHKTARAGSRQADLDSRMGEAVPMEVLGITPTLLFDAILKRRSVESHEARKGKVAKGGVVLPENAAALSPQDADIAAEEDDEKVHMIYGLLSTLSPRHQLMVKLHYGIGTKGGKTYSQQEIGRRFGITGARVGLVERMVKGRLAERLNDHVRLKEPDNRNVWVFEGTNLNPDSEEFARIAALPAEELRARFGLV